MSGQGTTSQFIRHSVDLLIDLDQHVADTRRTSRIVSEIVQLLPEAVPFEDKFQIRQGCVAGLVVRRRLGGRGRGSRKCRRAGFWRDTHGLCIDSFRPGLEWFVI